MEGMKYDEYAPQLKILSIDWDYFIDATIEERQWMFPDGGNENLPQDIQTIVWANRYVDSDTVDDTAYGQMLRTQRGIRSLRDIDANYDQINKLAQVIRWIPNMPKFYVAESHKEIAYAFAEHWNSGKYGSVKIVNIDHHSDMYDRGTDVVDCGNWFYHIITQLGKINPAESNTDNMINEYIWVHNKDSQTEQYDIPDSVRPYVTLQEEISVGELLDEYDIIFICKSSMWSPPHLDELFIRGVHPIQYTVDAAEFDCDVLIDRMIYVEKQIEAERPMREEMKKLVAEMSEAVEGLSNKVEELTGELET